MRAVSPVCPPPIQQMLSLQYMNGTTDVQRHGISAEVEKDLIADCTNCTFVLKIVSGHHS